MSVVPESTSGSIGSETAGLLSLELRDPTNARARLVPYEKYKDSEVEWVGEVPRHWEIKRLKTVAQVELSGVDKKTDEGQESVELCNYTHVYNNERITRDLEFMRASATPEEIRRLTVRAGDVLITKDSESPTDIAVPALVGPGNWDGVLCGYHLALVRPFGEWTGPFLARAFSALGVRDQFHMAADGVTRFALGGAAIRAAVFAIPPADERQAISEFLDLETAKIDALAAKKERLIDLLREKRAALITEAVTRGLDTQVATKQSGVDWLTEIPAHWQPIKIKRLFRQAKRQGYPDRTVLSVYRDYGVIERSSRDDNFNRRPEDLNSYQLVNKGDLVINKMKAWQGSLGVSQLSGITSPDYVVYEPQHHEVGAFLHHFLRNKHVAGVYITMSNGIRPSQWRLEPERFENLSVFVPPYSEQVEISAYIDRATRRIDQLIVAAERGMACLSELRTAVISAAVTGKIDVRDGATPSLASS